MARDKAPWSDAEKLHLLLEIAKQNTNPDWRHIEVPKGRVKADAQKVFNTMKSPPPSVNTKKRRGEEMGYPPGNLPSTGQSSSAGVITVPVTKRKRGRPTKAETEARKAAEARGEILPKPKPYTPKTTSNMVVGPDGQLRRRRGRPTKMETEARKAKERELKKKQGDDDEDDEKVRQQVGQSEQSELAEDDEDELEDDE